MISLRGALLMEHDKIPILKDESGNTLQLPASPTEEAVLGRSAKLSIQDPRISRSHLSVRMLADGEAPVQVMLRGMNRVTKIIPSPGSRPLLIDKGVWYPLSYGAQILLTPEAHHFTVEVVPVEDLPTQQKRSPGSPEDPQAKRLRSSSHRVLPETLCLTPEEILGHHSPEPIVFERIVPEKIISEKTVRFEDDLILVGNDQRQLMMEEHTPDPASSRRLALPLLALSQEPAHKRAAAETLANVLSDFFFDHPEANVSFHLVLPPGEQAAADELLLDEALFQLIPHRVTVVAGPITALRSQAMLGCAYLVAPANWRLTAKGSPVNKAIHSAAGPELEALTKAAHPATMAVSEVLYVPLPSGSPLRLEDVVGIIHVLSPVFQPDSQPHRYAEQLAKAYTHIVDCFFAICGPPPVSPTLSPTLSPTPHPSPIQPSPFQPSPIQFSAAAQVFPFSPASSSSSSSSRTTPSPTSVLRHPVTTSVPPISDRSKDNARASYKTVLLSYITQPQKHAESIYLRSEDVTIVKDAFPKAKIHLLVLPNCKLDSLEVLTSAHVPILLKMIETANQVCTDLVLKNPRLQIRSGFHAIPSLSQLHMHIISQEFNSTYLKTKKHWNSFTTPFFIDPQIVLKQLQSQGRVVIDHLANEALLRSPLECFQCRKRFRDMPSLKLHLRQRHAG